VKRAALERLARLAVLDGLLQPPPRLLVVEDFRPALQRNLGDDFGHGTEVLESLQRQHVVAVPHEIGWPTAILGRAGARTAGASGIDLADFRLPPILDANFVAPGDVQVIFVDKSCARAEPQRRQRDVGRRR
jgi:hypothetical protein